MQAQRSLYLLGIVGVFQKAPGSWRCADACHSQAYRQQAAENISGEAPDTRHNHRIGDFPLLKLFFICPIVFLDMPAPPFIDLGSGVNTQETIQKLMEVESLPLRRLERDNRRYKSEIAIWEALVKHVKDLSEKSRELHAVGSPFLKRRLISSDPLALDGEAIYGAKTAQKNIFIERLAAKHELLSEAIPKRKELAKGAFVIQNQDAKQKLEFPGGKLEELANFLNAQASKLVEAESLQVDEQRSLIKLRAHKSGLRGALSFEDPDGILAQAGLLVKKDKQIQVDWQNRIHERAKQGAGPPALSQADQGSKNKQQENLYLRKTFIFPMRHVFREGDLVMDIRVKREAANTKAKARPEAKPKGRRESIEVGPQISTQVEDIVLEGKNIIRTRTQFQEAAAQNSPQPGRPYSRRIVQATLIYEENGLKKSLTFKQSLQAGKTQKWRLPLEKRKIAKGAVLKAIEIRSNGALELSPPYFEAASRLRPVKELQAPQDARLQVDGVPLLRSTNEGLKNLIPGAVINLKAPSAKPLQVAVQVDEDEILGKLKEWVKSYNSMLSYLRKHMRSPESREISVRNERPRQERGGIFAADSTAHSLKSQSHKVIASAYPAQSKGDFRVLAQIGISTGKIGARWEDIQAGLLQIDEAKLGQALSENPAGVRRLFAMDTKRGKGLDHGIAYRMEKLLKPYIKSHRGILSVRIQLLKDKIASNKDDVYRREAMLERKEENLQRQFGRMEQAIKRSRSMSDYIKRIAPRTSNEEK